MLCDWRACGYKQSYIRKNTDVGCGRDVKAGTLRDTQRGDGQSAVPSALPLALSASRSTAGVACRDPDEKLSKGITKMCRPSLPNLRASSGCMPEG